MLVANSNLTYIQNMAVKRKTRRARPSRRLDGEKELMTAASERAYYDALHQHFLDLAYERLKDPEYRAILEDFIEKTHLFLARKKKI